jgi:hypothetical protein
VNGTLKAHSASGHIEPDTLLTSIAHDRHFLEDAMTHLKSILAIAAVFATATVVSLPIAAKNAEAAMPQSLNQCNYNSRLKSVDCCNHIISLRGKPLWMQEANASCSTAVKCTSTRGQYGSTYGAPSTVIKRCLVQVIWQDGGSNGNDIQTRTPPRSRGQR